MTGYDDEGVATATRRSRLSGRAPARRHPTGRRTRLLHDVGVRRWRTRATVAERDVERVHPVMRATTVPRRRLVPGAVVLARVPFEPEASFEGPEACLDKIRPVIVVKVEGDEWVCRPCTSALSRLRYPWHHTEIEDLAAAGLTRPTGVKRRRVRLGADALIEVRGVLSERDLANVFVGDPAAGTQGLRWTGGEGHGHEMGV